MLDSVWALRPHPWYDDYVAHTMLRRSPRRGLVEVVAFIEEGAVRVAQPSTVRGVIPAVRRLLPFGSDLRSKQECSGVSAELSRSLSTARAWTSPFRRRHRKVCNKET